MAVSFEMPFKLSQALCFAFATKSKGLVGASPLLSPSVACLFDSNLAVSNIRSYFSVIFNAPRFALGCKMSLEKLPWVLSC